MTYKNESGFTLVELSIVLVIIGLLIGGLLTGQTLIRKSEIKTIGTEFSFYQKAVTNFRDQYLELPGDMSRATQYWGAAANCPGTTAQGTTDGTTCDGDGDGKIQWNGSSNEMFRLWQHLANADLIEGVYQGVTGPEDPNVDAVGGFNAPESSFNNALWNIRYLGNFSGSATAFPGNYGHFMELGGKRAGYPYAYILKPKEQYAIDVKLDDGRPGTGKLIVHLWDDCTNAADSSAASALTAEYNLDLDEELCSILFLDAF